MLLQGAIRFVTVFKCMQIYCIIYDSTESGKKFMMSVENFRNIENIGFNDIFELESCIRTKIWPKMIENSV